MSQPDAVVRFCSRCGVAVASGGAFCWSCGAAIGIVSQSLPVAEPSGATVLVSPDHVVPPTPTKAITRTPSWRVPLEDRGPATRETEETSPGTRSSAGSGGDHRERVERATPPPSATIGRTQTPTRSPWPTFQPSDDAASSLSGSSGAIVAIGGGIAVIASFLPLWSLDLGLGGSQSQLDISPVAGGSAAYLLIGVLLAVFGIVMSQDPPPFRASWVVAIVISAVGLVLIVIQLQTPLFGVASLSPSIGIIGVAIGCIAGLVGGWAGRPVERE